MNRLRYVHISLAAALLALIIWKSDLSDARRVLSDVDIRLLAAVVALNVPLAALYPLRSHFVLVRLGTRVEARILVPTAILGNVAGSLTPAASGELLRTAVLRSHAGVATRDGLALVLYERAISVYFLALGTGVAVAFLGLPRHFALAVAGTALPLLALPALAPLFLRFLPKAPAARGGGGVQRALQSVREVTGALHSLSSDRKLLVTWSVITIAMFAILTVQYWLVARSVSHVIGPDKAWTALGASQLAGVVSLLPFGLGAADGSLAALLRRMGMTLEQGTVVAVLVRMTVTVPLGLLAVASYLYLARRAPLASEVEGDLLPVVPKATP